MRAAQARIAAAIARPTQTPAGIEAKSSPQLDQSNWLRTLLIMVGLTTIAATSMTTCETSPASEFRPTEPTAAPRPSPCLCRKRTFTTIPPVPAGRRWLAKLAATWTANTLRTGGLTGIEPNWVIVPTTSSMTEMNRASRSHPTLACARARMPRRTSPRLFTPMITTATTTPKASRIWGREESASALLSTDREPSPCDLDVSAEPSSLSLTWTFPPSCSWRTSESSLTRGSRLQVLHIRHIVTLRQ